MLTARVTSVDVEVRGQAELGRYCPQLLFTLLLCQGVSVNTELTDGARLAGQQAPGSSCLCLAALGLQGPTSALAFSLGAKLKSLFSHKNFTDLAVSMASPCSVILMMMIIKLV